jgi:hypothetical protein
MPPETRCALASFETVIKNIAAGDGQRDLVCKIRFCDKVRALELLGNTLGCLPSRSNSKTARRKPGSRG